MSLWVYFSLLQRVYSNGQLKEYKICNFLFASLGCMRGGQALSSHWPVAAVCSTHCHISCLLRVCVVVKGPINKQIMRNVPSLHINRPRLIANSKSRISPAPRLTTVANVSTCFTNADRCSRCKDRNIVNCCVLRSTRQNH